MTDISKFIPELSAICTIYSGILSGKSITCKESLFLVAFNNSFPAVHDVEAGIMDLVLNAPTERMNLILKSLSVDLGRIVTLYNDNSRYYDHMDLRLLWYKPLSFVDNYIETQQKKAQEASGELKDASNSYEMTPFNGMSKEEADVLERRVDKLTAEYQKEKAKLQNFYAKRKSLEDHST